LSVWLRCPATAEEIRARQASVAELRSQLDVREELAVLASEVPSSERFSVWMAEPEDVETAISTVTRWLSVTAALLCLTTFLGWVCGVFGPIPFLGVLLLERVLAWSIRRRFPDLTAILWQPRRGLAALAALLERVERIQSSSDRLRQLGRALLERDYPSSRRLAQLGYLLALAPLASLWFWGTPLALAVVNWRGHRGRSVGLWVSALGEYEALCALAAYAFENPSDPFPEIVPERPYFNAEDLGHPLLPRACCVPNDVRLDGEPRVLIVSGSNMSGKSTYLRTVGINAVLALMGAPVRARRLRLSPLVVGATLRIQDSLQAGRSRFYAEALRVRQLLDLAKQSPPLLFLLDELFQGTNSQDRRVGAEAVLRILINSGAIGMVTTHDLALTDIADRLAPLTANVHFEDRFDESALVFNYRLRPGKVQSGNGLALLRAVGIEV
jgi:DNA mismatch repair ATPase MutS